MSEIRVKKSLKLCAKQLEARKISGAVLLSHSQLYSTIAAGALNYRVREGNVCFNPAMDTGKYYNEKNVSQALCREEATSHIESNPFLMLEKIPNLRKKVVKPHGRLVMVS